MAKRGRKGNELGPALAKTGTPLFLLDRERRLVAFNSGCELLTGWTAAEVVGETCHYASISDLAGAAALAASLCPPPDVFGGEPLSAPAYVARRDGAVVPQLLHFFPFKDDKERVVRVLGIAQPLPQPQAASPPSPARELHAELAAVRNALRSRFGPQTLVAHGLAMRKVLEQLRIARDTEAHVLFLGEPGSGREHLARVIHSGSPGRGNWFVPLDCRRSGPEELDRVWTRLLESSQPVSGLGAPQPGTVYLAEVEAIPRDLQERLVRIYSGAGPNPAPPLRLLSSMTCDPARAIAGQSLRADFLALISPLTISVPALRERTEDLPILAQHFLEECNREGERQIGGFDDGVWSLLQHYHWPLNLDELHAVVREAHALATDTLIRPADLPFRFRTALESQDLPPPAEPPPLRLDECLTNVEKRMIVLALERSRNNRSKAAEMLGIHRARLLRRIEQLGLGEEKSSEVTSGPLAELSDELLRDDSGPEEFPPADPRAPEPKSS
jgi:DNA-binding NtrC family response regulator